MLHWSWSLLCGLGAVSTVFPRICAIYINKEAYTPKLVSIGPFHHNLIELRGMEMQKLRYFKDFLYRTRKSQECLLKIIQNNEVRIRHCYSEDCKLSSTYFFKMIILYAIFIIELFLKVRDKKKKKKEKMKKRVRGKSKKRKKKKRLKKK
jgi:hypothetical protein